MGASADARREERELICAAMVAMAATCGYQATTIEGVLDRAGVDLSAFDRHFESLEDCFTVVWEKVDAELGRRMDAASGRRDLWQDRLREALRALLGYLALDEDRARIYAIEVMYVNDRMRDRQRDAMSRLGATIELGRADAPEEDRVPPGIAEAVCGAIWHRIHQLVQAGRVTELPEELARFMYLAVLPYLGTAAAEAELART